MIAFEAPLFCSRHQRLNIKENKICSECLGIKLEIFIKKSFEIKLFPLGEKRENTLKKGPEGNDCFSGPHFLFQTPEGQH